MSRKKPVIFISHIHEDSDIAIPLKEFLDDAFLGFFNIFVASDGASIRAGDNWSATLETALKDAELVIVLISNESIERRWIYFEAGGAYFMGKRVLPICCRGFSVSQLGLPLSWLQAIEGSQAQNATMLIDEIATTFEFKRPPVSLSRLTDIIGANTKRPFARRPSSELSVRPLPVFLLLDTSGSMAGARISLIQQGLVNLIDYLQQPEGSSFMPLLSIITFGSGSDLLLPPTPVASIDKIPELLADGVTDLGHALVNLSKLLSDPAAAPNRSLQPFILVVTDGYPTDDFSAGVKAVENTVWWHKANRLCLALGDSADSSILSRLSNLGVVSLSEPYGEPSISSFFRWLSTIINKFVSPKTSLTLPPMPPGVELL